MLRKKIGGECVNFQDVFRDLVQLSESGLKEIGEYMGYESSYISKWHSGKKLSSQRTSSEILEKLSYYFSEKIRATDNERELILRFPSLGQTIDKFGSQVLILSLLEDGYTISLEEDRVRLEYNDPAVQSVMKVTGEARIMEYCVSLIYRGCCTVSRDISIHITSDFIALLSHGAIALKDYVYTKQERITLRFFVFPKQNKEEAMSELIQCLHLMSKLPFFDVEIYDGAGMSKLDTIVMEGAFAGSGFYGRTGTMDVLFVDFEEKTIQKIFEESVDAFQFAQPIIQNNATIDLAPLQMKRATISGENAFYYMPYLPVYFANENLQKQLAAEGKIPADMHFKWNDIRNLIVDSSKSETTYILKESTLLDCVERNVAHSLIGEVEIGKERMIEVLTELADAIAQSRDGSFLILQDRKYQYEVSLPEMLIWASRSDSFLIMSERAYYGGKERLYTPILSEKVSSMLYQYFEELCDHPAILRGTASQTANYIRSLY